MTNEQQETPGTDLEVMGTVEYGEEAAVLHAPSRTVDMRDRVTDSWTDVLYDVGQLTRSISDTELVPEALRGRPGAVGGVVLKGRELGLPPMTALSSVFSVKGQLGMKAETMRALILQRGHDIVVEETTTASCTMLGRRKGSERWTRVTWTLDDARKAGTKNMDRFPRQMLQARATTELARLVFPDVIAGLRSVEELEEETETVALPPATSGPGATTTVARQPKKRAASKKPAATRAVTPPEPDLPDEATMQAPEPDLPDAEPPAPAPADDETPTTGPAGTVEDADERGRAATRSQVGLIHSQAKRLGFEDRDERLQVVSRIVERDLPTTSELTVREARAVLAVLEASKDRDDLIEALASMDKARASLDGSDR